MEHPNQFWLVPWSTGYKCFTKKPEGFSIHVVEHESEGLYQIWSAQKDISDKLKNETIHLKRLVTMNNAVYQEKIDSLANEIAILLAERIKE